MHLEGLTNLEGLNLPSVATDAGLRHLRPLTNLKSLGFTNAFGVEGTGLVHLENARELRALDLSGTSTRGDNLQHIAHLPLVSLQTSQKAMTDAGMVHIAKLTGMRELHISNTSVTDAGLVHLAQLKNVEGLGLSENRCMTDAGLRHISGMKKLKRLFLSSNNITDECLPILKAFPDLVSINLQWTFISPKGISELENTYPSPHPRFKSIRGETFPRPSDKHMAAVHALSKHGGQVTGRVSKRGGKETFVSEVFFGPGWTGSPDMFQLVRQLDGLQELYLHTPIDESAVQPLSKIVELKSLRLRNPDVSDDQLRFLQSIPGIERVTLFGPFSDDSIAVLGGLTQLRFLTFTDSALTDTGLTEIERLLPQTRITRRTSSRVRP